MKLRLPILLLTIFMGTRLFSQPAIFPVNVTTQLIPPYSVNLADYAAPGCEQLRVIIIQGDLTQAPYRLFLRMEIELNGRVIVRTSPQYIPPPLVLDPGIPTVISGSDLYPFLDPQNMEFIGYSRESYLRTKTLPEGAYRISFTAYDYTRQSVALSSGGSMYCYLARVDPPVLNLPLNNTGVNALPSQSVNFQWISRSTASPNSALTTRYLLEIFEMRVSGMNPDEIVQSSRPVFTTETDRTSYAYTIIDPPLEKGLRYAWRVRAFDAEGRDYIRNNGYSEVFSFVYGVADDVVMPGGSIENFHAEAVSPRTAKLEWDPSTEFDGYKVYYRKQGETNKWYEEETVRNTFDLYGLASQTIYECRVQGKKGSLWGGFSSIDTLETKAAPVIKCETALQAQTPANREPLQELRRLQEIEAGGFMITVIEARGGNGYFTGRGFAQVPLFANKKIRCGFSNIFVNNQYQLVEGKINLVTDKPHGKNNALWDVDEEFEGGKNTGAVNQGTDEAAVTLPDFVVKDAESITLDTETQELVIVDEEGTTHRVDVSQQLEDKPETITVKDEEGNLYCVDTQSGKAASVGKAGSLPLAPEGEGQTTIAGDIGIVYFEPEPDKTKYAFDVRNAQYAKSLLFSEAYKTLEIPGGPSYDVPFKLIPVGETDVVAARFVVKDQSAFKAEKIIFQSSTGTQYKGTLNGTGDKYILTLPSGKDNDGIEVYALYPGSNGKYDVLGKLIVVSYAAKRPKVVLVPVNGNSIDETKVKAELDKIYHPVAVDWQVSKDENFEVTVGNLDVSGSGLFSMYTEGMKNLNNAFIAHKGDKFAPSAVYLFMLQWSTDAMATGDMPRSKQFGYIFTKTAQQGGEQMIYRTIAHELGHGIFRLKHTFDGQYQIAQSSTDNLMDYTTGTELVKHQWDGIHAPGLALGLFESDADAQSVLADPIYVKKTIEEIRCAFSKGESATIRKNGYVARELNHADNLKLSDGNTYETIEVEVFQEGDIKINNPQVNDYGSKRVYAWGKTFQIIVYGANRSKFDDYIFPNSSDFTKQLISEYAYAVVKNNTDALDVLSECSAALISTTDRLNFIELLAKGDVDDREERIILRLLRTTPPEQAKDILAGLVSKKIDGKSLVVKLVRGIDDKILVYGGNNFRQLMIEFRNMVNRSGDLSSRLDELGSTENFQKRLIKWQNKEIGAVRAKNASLDDDGLITISREFYDGIEDIPVSAPKGELSKSREKWIPYNPLACGPFDLVFFVNCSNLDVINEATEAGKDELIIVPAIYLEYARKKTLTDNTLTFTATAADVATIVFSGGTVALATNISKLRKAWLLFETLNSVINLTVNYSVLASNADWKKTIDAYNVVVCLLTLGEGSYNLSKININEAIQKVQNAGTASAEALKNAGQNFYDALSRIDISGLSAEARPAYDQFMAFAEKLKVKYGLVATRYIAKTGNELEIYLNKIINLPEQVSYKGNWYRNIDSKYTNPIEIHAGITDLGNRYRKGLYISETQEGNLNELLHYNSGTTAGRTMYEISNVEVDGLLDLTDNEIVKKLGITFDQLKLVSTDNKVQYEFTQVIAIWAKKNGYSGIKFFGARNTSGKEYVNFVIFEQNKVNDAIKGTINILK